MGRSRFVVFFGGIFLLFSLTAQAQRHAASTSSDPTAGNLYAGYTLLHQGEGIPALNGWFLSAEAQFKPHLSAVFEVNGAYGSKEIAYPGGTSHYDFNRTLAMFGTRFPWKVGRVRPFVQTMIGISRAKATSNSAIPAAVLLVSDPLPGYVSNSSNDLLAMSIGGGVDIRLRRSLAWRAQVDRFKVGTADGSGGDSGFTRVTTGLVFNF
jgi:hypothetical protein